MVAGLIGVLRGGGCQFNRARGTPRLNCVSRCLHFVAHNILSRTYSDQLADKHTSWNRNELKYKTTIYHELQGTRISIEPSMSSHI